MAVDIGDFFKEKGEPSEGILIALAVASMVFALAKEASKMDALSITALAVAVAASQLALTVIVVRLVLRSKIKELDQFNKKSALLTFVNDYAENLALMEGNIQDPKKITAKKRKILSDIRLFVDPSIVPEDIK